MTKSRGILGPRKIWSDADIALLTEQYPNKLAAEVAAALGVNPCVVYAKAKKLGLKKSDEFNSSPASGRLDGLRGADIPLLKVECTSLYTVPIDEAPIVVDRTGWPIERPVNSKNTLVCKVHGVDSFYSKFSVNLGNQIQHNDLAGGYEEIVISDRKPTGSITVLAELLATINPFLLAENSTNVPIQVVHGITLGEKVQVDLNTKIISVAYEDMNGAPGYNLGLSPDPVATDDEIKLTFL